MGTTIARGSRRTNRAGAVRSAFVAHQQRARRQAGERRERGAQGGAAPAGAEQQANGVPGHLAAWEGVVVPEAGDGARSAHHLPGPIAAAAALSQWKAMTAATRGSRSAQARTASAFSTARDRGRPR